jgi:hypothetical protein
MLPRGRCPPGRRKAEGSAGCAQIIDVGRHRVVREAELSTWVHRLNSPEASSSAPLA